MSFVLLTPDYERAISVILENTPEFGDSIEYAQLDEVERKLPGVVCGAFARFLARFQQTELLERGLSERDAATLVSTYRTIELLAASGDEEVETLLEEELFENLDCSADCRSLIRSRLGPKARGLFDRVWSR